MKHRPKLLEPHPLDFDWRFSAESAERLADLVINTNCLCLGTPTIALKLQLKGSQFCLIDRQPIQLVRCWSIADVNSTLAPRGSFDTVVTDPPWYLGDFRRWLTWVTPAVRPGGRIFVSLWDASTRPTAESEREQLLNWLGEWSDIEVIKDFFAYDTPNFEIQATATRCDIGETVRKSDLLILTPRMIPPLEPAHTSGKALWHRFTFGAYQLALRARADDRAISIEPHPNVSGWIWPSVSRRMPGRERIDLWSSRNEVAVVSGNSKILEQIRNLQKAGSRAVLKEPRFAGIRILQSWGIPDQPFTSEIEWTHLE